MTTRPSQGEFGAALRAIDLPIIVYKPPDDARNWKPCDYMVWTGDELGVIAPAWFECKDVEAVNTFPFSELRASQLQGIREAERIGLPYWLAVYWRGARRWTISDAVKVLAWRVGEAARVAGLEAATRPTFEATVPLPTSIPRELLMSRFGIDSRKDQLSSNLKQVLLGEVP